jgi:RNA polymerase sigma-70 factor (ECF subfamily)
MKSADERNSAALGQWLSAARAGSREALGDALAVYRQYLMLVANRALDSDLQAKAGASDLVQETFLEAQRDFAQFDGSSPEQLQAWLLRILQNNVANLRRRYRATDKRQVARETPLEGEGSREDVRGQLFHDTPTPGANAARREQELALEEALARLPEDYRRAILWRHRENCSFEELGQRLERSPDAARMLWYRALKELQKVLGGGG